MDPEEVARDKLARGLISVEEWRAVREEHQRSLEAIPVAQTNSKPAPRLSLYVQGNDGAPDMSLSDSDGESGNGSVSPQHSLPLPPPAPSMNVERQDAAIRALLAANDSLAERVKVLEDRLRENDATFASSTPDYTIPFNFNGF